VTTVPLSPQKVRFLPPQAILLLGLCPALAVTARLSDALWMSLALLGVLLASTLVSSLVGLIRPAGGGSLRWFPALLATGAAATGVQVLFERYAPGGAAALGLYLPVLAVNCLVTCRAESAARGQPAGAALLAALVDGAVLSGCMIVIAAVREVLGSGTLTVFLSAGSGGSAAASPVGVVVIPRLSAAPARAVLLGTGAFLAAGYLAALFSIVAGAREKGSGRACGAGREP
jgi:Na+-translocating ferredoxin:NAD+ oxidoreductase subunit E